MLSRLPFRFLALATHVVGVAAGCTGGDGGNDDDDDAFSGHIDVDVTCGGGGCGPTGTLHVERMDCQGTVLESDTAAGVSLTSAGTPFQTAFSGLELGTHCVDAYLDLGTAGTIVASDGPAQVTWPENEEEPITAVSLVLDTSG